MHDPRNTANGQLDARYPGEVVNAPLSATRALSIWTVRGPTECRADWVVGLPSAFHIYYHHHHVASLNAPYRSIALCYAHSSCGAQRAALAFND